MKVPLELAEYRAKYYELLVKAPLPAVGVDIKPAEFVFGSSYRLTKGYTMIGSSRKESQKLILPKKLQ